MIPKRILPIIVLSQFAGTSLWFAGNAVLHDLQLTMHLDQHALANITTAVQIGFITGTLIFAILSIADRFSPVLLFFISCILASLFNLCIIWFATDANSLFILRFLTGFFLAGIYPVGMKIAADWHEKGLSNALGWLVGALVLGTALPHLLRGNILRFPWENVFLFTSLFALTGGLIVYLFVPDGPFRKQGVKFDRKNAFHIFKKSDFRAAAFGYFGHMWELYTFWAFVPLFVVECIRKQSDVSLISFFVIAAGALGCVAGGLIARKKGSAYVAFYALLISFICCCLSYFVFRTTPIVSIPFLLIWGIAVVADSPQFSTMIAQTASPEMRGTALTVVTSIGFAITIISLQLFNYLFMSGANRYVVMFLLALGPLLGLWFLRDLMYKKKST